MDVFVTIYNHRHGTDIAVFATEKLAEQHKITTASSWWEDELPDDVAPDDQALLAEEYFDRMADRGEFFTIEKHEIKGLNHEEGTDAP